MDVNSTLTRHFRRLSLEEKTRQQPADRPVVPLRRAMASEPKRVGKKRTAELPIEALEPGAVEGSSHKRLPFGHTPKNNQAATFVVHHHDPRHAAGTNTAPLALPRPTLPPLRPLYCDRLDQAQRRRLLQVARELTQVTTRSGARKVLERATASVEEQVRGKAGR